jgi:hypothetical protein
MDKQTLTKMLKEKRDYIEKLRAEMTFVSGQVVLIEEMLKKLEEPKETPKE